MKSSTAAVRYNFASHLPVTLQGSCRPASGGTGFQMTSGLDEEWCLPSKSTYDIISLDMQQQFRLYFVVYDRAAAPAGDRGALKASKDAPERPVN